MRFDQARRRRRRCGGDLARQAVTLVGVEDRESPQERNGTGRLAGLPSSLAFFLRREAIRISSAPTVPGEAGVGSYGWCRSAPTRF
jgi:hypothetical protein